MHRNWVFQHKPGRQANSHLLRPKVLGDLLSPQNRTLQVHQSASCSSFPDPQLHLRPNKPLRNPQPSRRRRRNPKQVTNEWRRMRRRTKKAITKQKITTMRMRRRGRDLNPRTTEKTRHLSMKTLSKPSSPFGNFPSTLYTDSIFNHTEQILRAVVKLGGALFGRDPDPSTIKHMAGALTRFVDENNQLVLVAGGGENARTYINAARKLGAEESTCDLLGIQITRANAELPRVAFEGETAAVIARSLTGLPELVRANGVVVMGGLQPGQSTHTVATLAAEITRAKILVNATDVDGVYTEDPKKNPRAKLLRT